MTHIRPATASDIDTIRRIIRIGKLPPFSLNWEHFLVAEVDGQVVGVGQIRHHGAARELGSLAVLPEFRGQGIAAELIAALEVRAGFPVYLFCEQSLEVYYQRFGFRRIGFGELPLSIKIKTWIVLIIPPLFGFRVRAMRKDQPQHPAS